MAQNKKIEELENVLAIRDNTINVLQERIDAIEVHADDNEQYSRRSCLRIHNVEFDDIQSVTNVLKDCYDKMNLEFDKNDIDRAHRIGKKQELDDGRVVKSIIVKFKSWDARKKFFKARPRGKPGDKSFFVSQDLTSRRYNLLKCAKRLVGQNNKVEYAFCDINCSLGLKLTSGKFHYFNTKSKLIEILKDIE